MLNNKTILITGGTGSFGNAFTEYVLEHYNPKKIIIYSRDEYKQFIMSNRLKKYSSKLRFFIGDVRDKERLYRAFDGVDYVVHAAALKQVPACEYNPMEAVKTNIDGAMNIVDAALDCGVKRVVALSTYLINYLLQQMLMQEAKMYVFQLCVMVMWQEAEVLLFRSLEILWKMVEQNFRLLITV